MKMILTFFDKYSFLSKALIFSILCHLAVFAIHFAPPLVKQTRLSSTLDVVLVNAKSLTAPTKADVLAQANLDGGGNSEKKRRAKSAMPVMENQKQAKGLSAVKAVKAGSAEDSVQKAERKQLALEIETKKLMTQLNDKHKVEVKVAATPNATLEPSPTSKIDAQALVAQSLEIARLEAQIAKQAEAYQQRPKRKELGARTQEYRFSMYEEAWRQKVERMGNLNYPEALKNQNVSSKILFSIDIKSDGSVEKVVIIRSSGNAMIDDAAKHILLLAAPYDAFPADILKELGSNGIIGISRTMRFTRNDTLETE